MSKFKKTSERTLQDQLRIQMAANQRSNKIIEYLKKEVEAADQEIMEVYDRINFWIEYTAWLGNSSIKINGEEFAKNGLLQTMIDQLSEKDKGLLSSIVLTIICGKQSLESVLYLLVENKFPAINEEYQLSDSQSVKLSMN